jgi:hypothetical protein
MTGKCWHCGWNTAGYEEQIFVGDIDVAVGSTTTPETFWKDGAKWPTYPLADKKLTGLSSSYYELPEGCKELQDLIEYKSMNFARGNVFKAAYRLGDKPGTDQIYDWEKIIWFAQREIERLKKL